MKIRSKILSIMGVPIVFLGVSTVALVAAGVQTGGNLEEERTASAVAASFQQVERDVVDAENATRGYLIIGGQEQLDEYTVAVARLPREWRH